MKLECRHIAELPFNLNLPDGLFEVQLSSTRIPLHVFQERIAAYLGPNDNSEFFLLSRSDLARGAIGKEPVFTQRLRTVVELSDELEIPSDQMHIPTHHELVDEVARRLIIECTGLSGAALTAEAEARLSKQQKGEADKFAKIAALRLTAQRRVPARVHVFQSALNTLIRLYMARLEDAFVEEVSFHQLGGTITSGVTLLWLVDGNVVQQIAHVDKIPALMRGKWYDYGEAAVAEFRQALRDGNLPDSVRLLHVRARALLERGAYRSSIIEASAGLETALARKIHKAMTATGILAPQILAALKTYQRFPERAKTLLKKATGKSAASLDPVLWQRVLAHRERFRHAIAHSDLEPTKGEATAAIEDFARLAQLIEQIP